MIWHTVPAVPKTKRPAPADWENAARPGYGVESGTYAIACGPSGIVVIDCDTDKATGQPIGWTSVAEAARPHGGIPDTYMVATPSGGTHVYFLACPDHEVRNRAKRRTLPDGTSAVWPGVDVRGAGGCVIGAGSTTSGGTYEVIADAPLAALPEWLCAMVRRPERVARPVPVMVGRTGRGYGQAALASEIAHLLRAEKDTRNDQLNACAYILGQLVAARVLTVAEVADALESAAHVIGLEHREIRPTIMSGLSAGMRVPRMIRQRGCVS